MMFQVSGHMRAVRDNSIFFKAPGKKSGIRRTVNLHARKVGESALISSGKAQQIFRRGPIRQRPYSFEYPR